MRIPKYVQYPYSRDFLLAETKEGPWGRYQVSSKLKAIWLCELDMLQEFMRLCKKHELQWWAEGGTLLGAIRHKGFIPWDDDIDICMFRKDYEKFVEVAIKELKFPYFLDNYRTNSGCTRAFSKLRLEGTTCVVSKHELEPEWGVHPAVAIDIFPVDFLPESGDDSEFLNLAWDFRMFFDSRLMFRKHLYDTTPEEVRKVHRLYENVIRTYEKLRNPKYLETLSLAMSKKRHPDDPLSWMSTTRREVEWVRSTVDWPFEYLTIQVPVEYVKCLSYQYPGWETAFSAGKLHNGMTNPYVGYEEAFPELMDRETRLQKAEFEKSIKKRLPIL